MWYLCDLLSAVLYVRVSCFVVHGCAVSCVLMVEGRSVVANVMLSLFST